MANERFSRVVRWSDEDECFIAETLEIPGVLAHGDSPEEAVKELSVALGLYARNQDSLPEPRGYPTHSGQLRLRMPPTLHAQLALQAQLEGISLNQYICLLLERQLTVREAAQEVARRVAEFEAAAIAAASGDAGGEWRQVTGDRKVA